MTGDIRDQVLSIIFKLAETIHWNRFLNERHLHHSFSWMFQNEICPIDLTKDRIGINLHPEWPTYRKNIINFSRYEKNENGYYIPVKKRGSAGFIDFAIGNYERPFIGIEFTWKYGWDHKEMVYDLLKCLDGGNPFKIAISYNVIVRKQNLSTGGQTIRFLHRINEAFMNAVGFLGDDFCNDSREIFLIITEIGKNGRRHWHFNRTENQFINELPKICEEI